MNISDLLNLKDRLLSLTVFDELLKDEVVNKLYLYLESLESEDTSKSVFAYSSFVSSLYQKAEGNLSFYINDICNNCENVYVKLVCKKIKVNEQIKSSTDNDLSVLQTLANLTKKDLTECLNYSGFLADFISKDYNLKENYYHRIDNIDTLGFGKFAKHTMFYINEQSEIVAVKNADSTTFADLVDYEYERAQIVNNTENLLKGLPAANVLLTGDAGTGKSSTIKAVGNEYFKKGLRIVEVRKNQLDLIPTLMQTLSENPLKFILFIDDLSFSSDDDSYNSLKAVLEGSVSAKSDNTVIYATSNRRHIIKEKLSDRNADDIHINDAMQEMVSLSNRFGLHITFQKPNKQTYLNIVRELAKKNNINISQSDLDNLAERAALERGGRTARLARQVIDSLIKA